MVLKEEKTITEKTKPIFFLVYVIVFYFPRRLMFKMNHGQLGVGREAERFFLLALLSAHAIVSQVWSLCKYSSCLGFISGFKGMK